MYQNEYEIVLHKYQSKSYCRSKLLIWILVISSLNQYQTWFLCFINSLPFGEHVFRPVGISSSSIVQSRSTQTLLCLFNSISTVLRTLSGDTAICALDWKMAALKNAHYACQYHYHCLSYISVVHYSPSLKWQINWRVRSDCWKSHSRLRYRDRFRRNSVLDLKSRFYVVTVSNNGIPNSLTVPKR